MDYIFKVGFGYTSLLHSAAVKHLRKKLESLSPGVMHQLTQIEDIQIDLQIFYPPQPHSEQESMRAMIEVRSIDTEGKISATIRYQEKSSATEKTEATTDLTNFIISGALTEKLSEYHEECRWRIATIKRSAELLKNKQEEFQNLIGIVNIKIQVIQSLIDVAKEGEDQPSNTVSIRDLTNQVSELQQEAIDLCLSVDRLSVTLLSQKRTTSSSLEEHYATLTNSKRELQACMNSLEQAIKELAIARRAEEGKKKIASFSKFIQAKIDSCIELNANPQELEEMSTRIHKHCVELWKWHTTFIKLPEKLTEELFQPLTERIRTFNAIKMRYGEAYDYLQKVLTLIQEIERQTRQLERQSSGLVLKYEGLQARSRSLCAEIKEANFGRFSRLLSETVALEVELHKLKLLEEKHRKSQSMSSPVSRRDGVSVAENTPNTTPILPPVVRVRIPAPSPSPKLLLDSPGGPPRGSQRFSLPSVLGVPYRSPFASQNQQARAPVSSLICSPVPLSPRPSLP